MDMQRAMFKARYLPRYVNGDWAAIPPELLTEMVCDAVEANSAWERDAGAMLRGSARDDRIGRVGCAPATGARPVPRDG